MAAMLYVELELKRKVDSQSLLTRNKRDITEYVERDMLDNFSTFQQNVGVGPTLDAYGANQNTSKSTKTIQNKDSMEKKICFAKSGSC